MAWTMMIKPIQPTSVASRARSTRTGIYPMASREDSNYSRDMKTKFFRQPFRWLLLPAVVALFAAGCATHEQHSFNKDFNQSLPTAPNYYIEGVDATHFKVIATQGSPAQGADRIIYVKQAATAVAASEAKHRGWSAWDLNYISDSDRGWMREVIAEVSRKNAVEKSTDDH